MALIKNFNDYIILSVSISISSIIGLLLFFISFKGILRKDQLDKNTIYECGSDAFTEVSKIEFDVHYYLVGILFILFDLEIIFLLPWILSFSLLELTSIVSMCLFIIILTIIYIYEWSLGILDW